MMIKILNYGVGDIIIIYEMPYHIISITGDAWLLENVETGMRDKFSLRNIISFISGRYDV